MPLLSVAIITQNEERNLPRTLASVSFANEIVVVDSGSTDATVAIAESFGARVFQRPWPGFAAQKNFAIAQSTGDWVLSLDAGRGALPELCRQLSVLLPPTPPPTPTSSSAATSSLNRWIRHGGFYPDPKLRLFRRSVANFSPSSKNAPSTRPSSSTANPPPSTSTHPPLLPTLEDYLEHMDRYSTLGAQLLVAQGRTSRSSSPSPGTSSASLT